MAQSYDGKMFTQKLKDVKEENGVWIVMLPDGEWVEFIPTFPKGTKCPYNVSDGVVLPPKKDKTWHHNLKKNGSAIKRKKESNMKKSNEDKNAPVVETVTPIKEEAKEMPKTETPVVPAAPVKEEAAPSKENDVKEETKKGLTPEQTKTRDELKAKKADVLKKIDVANAAIADLDEEIKNINKDRPLADAIRETLADVKTAVSEKAESIKKTINESKTVVKVKGWFTTIWDHITGSRTTKEIYTAAAATVVGGIVYAATGSWIFGICGVASPYAARLISWGIGKLTEEKAVAAAPANS